ncbi:MAG: hypothetical protein FWG77_04625 [Treponema sp.]|nr:hypothetical protein [Treponema sp.]
MLNLEDIAKFLLVLAAISLSVCIISTIGLLLSPAEEETFIVYSLVIFISLFLTISSSAFAFVFRRIENKRNMEKGL